MKGKTWNITSTADLKKAALEVMGEHRPGPSVLALYGDLGAGKTTFTQVIGEILGVQEDITSPTFVIMKRYQTTHDLIQSLIHIDAYRLESPDELSVLGLEEWLQEPDALMVIEWADKVESLLPPHTIKLRFTLKGDERQLELLSS